MMKKNTLALIGCPIKQSNSDSYHNFFLSTMKLDVIYEKIKVTPHELAHFFQQAKRTHFIGLSVTMPLKECVMPLLDEIDDTARHIGAVNTVHFMEGKAYGFNTDGIGALKAIQYCYQSSLQGKRAIIVGAGGAAKAIAWTLKEAGVDLIIINRNEQRAKALASALDVQSAPIEEIKTKIQACDLLIQATSVGMHDNGVILSAEKVPSHVAVLDVIAKPQNQWLCDLSQRGCCTISGRLMWIFQAIEQYKIWFDCFKQTSERDLLQVLFQATNFQ